MGGLNVTIIGAGLAGLMSARVLREHHTVTIIERVSGKSEVGAAICLGCTATTIVEKYGFDRKRVGSIVWDQTRTFDKRGKEMSGASMQEFNKYTKADFLLSHRNDLWAEFLRLATAPSAELGIEGQPAKVEFGVDVVGVDTESGEVTLGDGRKIESDLVVGADGIRSIVRPLVVGEEAYRSARPSGLSAFRFTMPASTVHGVNPKIDLLDPQGLGYCDLHLSMDGSNRSVVIYPCRNHELLNFVCLVPNTILQKETKESWTSEGDREDLMRCFNDYGTYVTDLLSHASDVKLWSLRDQDPLPTYIKGRTVLIGDAAHAMAPHQAQGGTQSVEDAEGLSLFNKSNVSRSDVASILADFDSVRRPRASQIQNHTRQAHDRRDPETVWKNQLYNNTYGGIEKCLARLKAGEEMIQI